MNIETYCVIMAGGIGSRFWPVSRTKSPKQFLDILGTGKTLLQSTYERFRPICQADKFLIVTSSEYVDIVKEQIPEINENQILTEPFRRNTAPCIAFANTIIKKKNPNAIVIVTPSDHLITNEKLFVDSIETGVKFAQNNDALLTLGIKPHKAETAYGYVQIGKQIHKEFPMINRVKTFTEKPDEEMAGIFYESGEFMWNAGIFIWSLKTIEKAFEKYLPSIHSLFESFSQFEGTTLHNEKLVQTYSDSENISIDYGILEKADNVFVEITAFGWSDLGTWGSLYEFSEKDKDGNVTIGGRSMLYQTSNCIIHVPSNKVCVVQGLDDYIIVESKNAILICPKNNDKQIRQFSSDVKLELGINE